MQSNDSGLHQEELDRIRQVLRRNMKVKEILMFGSRAKGGYRRGSDIDLALKTDELLTLQSELDVLLLPYRIDLLNYNSIENPQLREQIDRTGLSLRKLVET